MHLTLSFLDMSDILNSTEIVISSDSLCANPETESGDITAPVAGASDSGNSSPNDGSLNVSAIVPEDIEMTEEASVTPAAVAAGADNGVSLYETVTMLSTRQKANFPATVPSSCLVDPALVSLKECLMYCLT